MTLRLNIGGVLQRFGCVLLICLLMLMLAVLVSPPIVSAGHAESMPAMATMVVQQPQHMTDCHPASDCAGFVIPSETLLANMRQLQSLRFIISDATRLMQFGPSTDSPPTRI